MGDCGAKVELETRDDCDAESKEEDWPFMAFGYPGLGSGKGCTRMDMMDGRVSIHFRKYPSRTPSDHARLTEKVTFWSFCIIHSSSFNLVKSFDIRSTSRTRCWIVLSIRAHCSRSGTQVSIRCSYVGGIWRSSAVEIARPLQLLPFLSPFSVRPPSWMGFPLSCPPMGCSVME